MVTRTMPVAVVRLQGSASGSERPSKTMNLVFLTCRTGLSVFYVASLWIIHGNAAQLVERKIHLEPRHKSHQRCIRYHGMLSLPFSPPPLSVAPSHFCVVLCKPVLSQGRWEGLMGLYLVFVQDDGSTAQRSFWYSRQFNKRSATQNSRTLKCTSAHTRTHSTFMFLTTHISSF